MLKQLSRMEKSRGFLIMLFVAIMAVSLVMFYAPGRNTGAGAGNETLATVGGEEVAQSDIVRRREQIQQRFGFVPFDAKTLLDGLVRDRLTSQEAARQGLGVSDAELAARIRKIYADENGAFVGEQRYKDAVIKNYGSVEKYERELRDVIAAEKLRSFVTAGVQISDAEVEEQFKRQGATFDVVYVPVTLDKVSAKIEPTDDETRKYYTEHQTDYRVLEPQKKIRYIFINSAKVGEKLNISDAELRAEYDRLPNDLKQGGAKIQQILLRIPNPQQDTQIRAKADNIVQQARAKSNDKTTVEEEEFVTLAKGYSEDPATAKGGGYLAAPVRPNKNRPNDPLQRALNLPPGAITEPEKIGNAYFIFRRGETVPKPFEDAKQEILVSLRNRRAFSEAQTLAGKIAAKFKENKDATKTAAEFAGEANTSAGDMVKETPFFAPGDNVPDIGVNDQFQQGIAGLNNDGDIGAPGQVPGGFAVPMLIGKRDANYMPTFEEVKDRARADVKASIAKGRIEQFAKDLANSTGSAGDLKAAAEKLGLTASTKEKFKLGTSLDTVGVSPAADDALFALKAGEVGKTPIKSGENWVVLGVTKREDADMKDFEKQRDTLRETALTEKRQQVFGDYIDAVERRYNDENRIKIDNTILAEIEQDFAAQQQQMRPNQLPFNLQTQ